MTTTSPIIQSLLMVISMQLVVAQFDNGDFGNIDMGDFGNIDMGDFGNIDMGDFGNIDMGDVDFGDLGDLDDMMNDMFDGDNVQDLLDDFSWDSFDFESFAREQHEWLLGKIDQLPDNFFSEDQLDQLKSQIEDGTFDMESLDGYSKAQKDAMAVILAENSEHNGNPGGSDAEHIGGSDAEHIGVGITVLVFGLGWNLLH